MHGSATDLVAPRRETHRGLAWPACWSAAAHPVVVQSMTNTDTADIDATVDQVAALARAGSELVRITVDRDEAAKAVPHIRDRLAQPRRASCRSSATSTTSATSCWARTPPRAEALDKYRINPGNVGFKDKKDRQFGAIIDIALRHGKAGAHRRQLGLARSRAADAPDGREREEQRAEGCARRHARGDRAVGAHLGGARRGAGARTPTDIILSAQGVGGAGSRQRLHDARRRAAATRCTSVSPKPAWARRASSPRPPASAFCCKPASATRSASRSRPSPAATARSR